MKTTSPALTYDAAGILTERPDDPYVQIEAATNQIPARKVPDLAAAVDFAVNKVLIVGDPEKMPHVEELMQQRFAGRLSIYRSTPFFLEVMPLGVEKAASLELLLRTQGLFAENLMACGDGWNDLPMIRFAGLGVAMGNAVPQVKAAADYVTADNDHDGVGLAVEKFILRRRAPLESDRIRPGMEHRLPAQDLPLPRRRDHPAGRDHPDRRGAHRRARRRAGYL